MDAKFTKRFESYQKSLAALKEARHRDMSDSFVLSGTSAKFCITFELAWKVLKDILVQYYSITNFVAGSPKEVLKKSFQAELISDDTWLEMLNVRNDLSHDYDESIIKINCEKIIGTYLDLFDELEQTVCTLLSTDQNSNTIKH